MLGIVVCLAAGVGFLRVGNNQQETGELRSSSSEEDCHDTTRLFVDGATRISALFGVEIVADHGDWPEIADVLQSFAREREWPLRDVSTTVPDVMERLAISICAPDQIVLSVIERYWIIRETNDGASRMPRSRAVHFFFYGDAPESVWQPVAAEFVAILDSQWPGRVRFRDENSYLTDTRPDFLN